MRNPPSDFVMGWTVPVDPKWSQIHDGRDRREGMSDHKPVVEQYIDGFRKGDRAQVLSCLADDVVWTIHGEQTIEGKEAFDREMATGAAYDLPDLVLDDLVEQGETVVAIGHGHLDPPDGDRTAFVFSEVFRFRRDLVRSLDTFHIDLTD